MKRIHFLLPKVNHALFASSNFSVVTCLAYALILAILLVSPVRAVGTFTALKDPTPGAANAGLAPGPVGLMLLLPDGRVMCSNPTTSAAWYMLTPDSQGKYKTGKWSTLTSMAQSRRFVSSVVMRDGRVFIAGGEYGSNGTRANGGRPANSMYLASAEIYTPGAGTTGTWANIPAVPSTWTASRDGGVFAFGDSSAVLMPNDRILIGPVYNKGNNCTIYDIQNNAWIDGPAYQTGTDQAEASWVKLKDGSILTINSASTTTQRYVPGTPPNNGSWVADVSVPQNIYDIPSAEIGAGLLLPSGQALFLGGNGKVAIYTPANDATPASWRMGANMPNVTDTTNPSKDTNAFGIAGAADSPVAVLTNGKVLCALARAPHTYVDNSVSPPKTVSVTFSSTTYLYEYDPGLDSWSALITTNPKALWQTGMLDLPDGTVLFSDTTNQLWSYQADGAPLAAWKPTISNFIKNSDGTYHLTGTQLNGLSQGAMYGDDLQTDTNYPIVSLTSGSNVYYARTFNWSSTGVQTGNAPVTTEFALPAGLPNGNYSLQVIANGIASDAVPFSTQSQPPVVTVTAPAHGSEAKTFSALTGTATDNGGPGIAGNAVNLTLYHIPTGQYWTGSGWSSTQATLSVTVDSLTNIWSRTSGLPTASNGTLREGRYSLAASTHDNAGTNSVAQSGVNNIFFTVDNTAPTGAITAPAHGSVIDNPTYGFSGTASDNESLSRVILFIRRNADNLYWNGSTWLADSLQANLSATLSGGTWTSNFTHPVPGPQMPNGSYTFIALIDDEAGNRVQKDSVVTLNSNGPAISIASPTVTLSSTGYSFNGTSQSPAGVQAVNCFIRRNSDFKYWNGSAWGVPPINLPTNHTAHNTNETRPWTCVSPNLPQPGADLAQGSYTFIAIGTDGLGGVTQRDSVVLIDDAALPQVTVTSPAHNAYVSTLVSISGTATDLSGIQENSVVFTLYNDVTGTFWDGTNWVGNLTALHATLSGSTWTYNSPPTGSKLGEGRYYLSVHATDGTGALSAAVQGVNQTTFYVDGGPPTVSITTPPHGTTITALPSISGTAGDSIGVASVRLYLYRYSDGNFWDSSAWGGGGSAILATQVTGNTWSSTAAANLPQPGPLPSISLTNGVYDIIAFAVDAAGNQTRTDSIVTVDYHPVFTWTGAVNNDWDDSRNWLLVGSAATTVPDANAAAVINSGSPTIPAAAQRQVYRLEMTGGVFQQSELTVLNKFDWTGGQIWGTINVSSDGTLNISGPNPKYLIAYGLNNYGNPHQQGVLNNAGTATWTGDGEIQMQHMGGNVNSARFNNSGTFQIKTDADITNYNGGGFTNTGEVDKTASTGLTRMDVNMINNGVMRADTGRISFSNSGGVSTGEYQLTSSQCFEWSGGTHTLGTGAKFTGTGSALISAGALQGAADTPAGPAVVELGPDAVLELATNGNLQRLLRFTGSGQWRWTGGTVLGTVDVDATAHLQVSGSDTKWINAYNLYNYGNTDGRGIINNAGTSTWEGTGELQLQFGAKFFNTGSLTITSDADLTNYAGGNFINQGLLRKAGSNGVTVVNGVVFSSPGGTLDVQTGVVSLTNSSAHTFDTGTQLTGSGRTRVDSATLTATGNIGGNGNFEVAVGGILAGTHTFLASTFHWTGGSIIGITSIGTAATLDIEGSETKYLQGYNLYNYGNLNAPGVLVNHGTASWTGIGGVEIQFASLSGSLAGGTFLNDGTMSILTDADMTVYVGGNFINTGTLRKEQSTGVTRFDVTMSNHGTLNCLTGKVQINGGGASSGRFDMPIPNALEFTAGTNVLAHGASFTSAGKAKITGGTVAFANTVPNDVTLGAGSGLELATGGTLSRDGSFIGSGVFQFSGGTITGTTNFNGATLMEISGPDQKLVSAYGIYNYGNADGRGTLNLNSTTVWSGSGGVQLQYGAILRNTSLMDLRTNALVDEYAGGKIYNTGTLRKSVGTGLSRFSNAVFDNSGTLDIQTGVLSLVGNHGLNAGTTLTGAGRLRTDGGTLTVTGTVAGTGHFEHAVGVLNGTHTINAATLHWTGGEISGVTTIAPAAVLDISGTATKFIQGYGLYNYGDAASPGIINNFGSATWTGSGIQAQFASGIGARFNNFGTFRVQTTAGFSEYAGGSFVNSGQLVIGSSPGIFNISAGFQQTAAGVLNIELAGTNAATPEFDQIHGGACTLDGTINVTLLGNYTPTVGTSFPIITYASHTGQFAICNAQGAYFSRTYNSGNLTLTAIAAPANLADWTSAYFDPASPLSNGNADPDGDGQSNFAEYAFHSNPTSSTPAPQGSSITRISNQDWLTVNYRRWADRAADGVTYAPETGNLTGWSTAGIVDEVDPTAPVIPGSTACRCRVPVTPGAVKFLRVRAAKP